MNSPRVNDRVQIKRHSDPAYGTIIQVPQDSLYLGRWDKFYEVRLDKPIVTNSDRIVDVVPLYEWEFVVIGHLCQ